MTVLVFGQTGQVARALQRQGQVTSLSRAQADLTDPAACHAAILAHQPVAVINAAAYTAVDTAETEPDLAQTINSAAPGAMARACAQLGIPFCHLSTDYVFDGSAATPWHPSDDTKPLGVYGASKLAGEQAVRDAGGQHVILRTSWVFSADGANFVRTMLRLSETRSALNIVADQIGGPTPAAGIAEAALRITAALRAGAKGGTYHYAGQPATSWAGFARAIFHHAGRAVTVHEIASADYPTPAKRPLNSRLDCATLTADFGITPPDWNAHLAQVIKDLSS